jgi:hypothetical protein
MDYMDSFVLKEGDTKITDPYKISNLFNENFIKSVQNLSLNSGKSGVDINKKGLEEINFSGNYFKCPPTDEKEVNEIVKNFKNKLSSGYDEIPLKLIKSSIKPLLKPLVHLINSSFITGVFPAELKISKVVPVHKKGCRMDVGNFRPVSVPPAISKIFEKVMLNRLADFLEKNNLFDKEQHGFRKGKSVTTALVEFTESIINSVDRGEKPFGIFMDLTKAFDTISHSILLKKLDNIGIKGRFLKWFESYLSNRFQYVEIPFVENNKLIKVKSRRLKVLQGVPQGSILGPVLFLCYIQGFPKILHSADGIKNELILYADDSNLIVSSKNEDELAVVSQNQIIDIQNYLKNNNLFLNLNKTNFIEFGTKQNRRTWESSIIIEKDKLNQVNSTKFLGLEVDDKLSWDLHIKSLEKKIHSGIFMLKRMASLCNRSVLKMIYHAHIHSHISYGLCVYGGTTNYNLHKILLLQKRAIRIILNLKWDDHVREHFRNLEIFTVYDQYIYDCILYIKNNFNNLELRSEFHSYNTRNKNNINIQKHKLSFFTKKTTYMGTKFYNLLPIEIKDENDFFKFKKKLKTFLINEPHYSIKEFVEGIR